MAVARGPVVYCVEDIDNPWVEEHFKVCSTSIQDVVTRIFKLLIVTDFNVFST